MFLNTSAVEKSREPLTSVLVMGQRSMKVKPKRRSVPGKRSAGGKQVKGGTYQNFRVAVTAGGGTLLDIKKSCDGEELAKAKNIANREIFLSKEKPGEDGSQSNLASSQVQKLSRINFKPQMDRRSQNQQVVARQSVQSKQGPVPLKRTGPEVTSTEISSRWRAATDSSYFGELGFREIDDCTSADRGGSDKTMTYLDENERVGLKRARASRFDLNEKSKVRMSKQGSIAIKPPIVNSIKIYKESRKDDAQSKVKEDNQAKKGS